MKVTLDMHNEEKTKAILEEAMFKALLAMGDQANEISFFCTCEEELILSNTEKAA